MEQQEHLKFQPGELIRRKNGDVGHFVEIRRIGEIDYVYADFSTAGYKTNLPLSQRGKLFDSIGSDFGTKFEVVTIPMEKDTRPIVKKSALDRTHSTPLVERLRAYIEGEQGYSLHTFHGRGTYTPLLKPLADLIHQAKERDLLFRGEGRLPEIVFSNPEWEGRTYLTASLSHAAGFPWYDPLPGEHGDNKGQSSLLCRS